MLKMIALKIYIVSCFLSSCPFYEKVQNIWICQCFSTSVVFIEFLKKLVYPIPYLVVWNSIVCVSVLFEAAQCHRLHKRPLYWDIYFKFFVVSRWKTKKTQTNLDLLLVFPRISVKLESLFYKQSPETQDELNNADFHVNYSHSFDFCSVK